MKFTNRILTLILAVVLIFSGLWTVPVAAFDETDGTLNYLVDEYDGTVWVTGAVNKSITGTVVIPSAFRGFKVTEIYKGAFENCTGISGVVIPDSVTFLSGFAFKGCTGLKSIEIPDSVTEIEWQAFYGCTSLKSITLPDHAVKFNAEVFENTGYYNDQSNWENGVLYIGKHAIASNSDLSGSYAIKQGTVHIGFDAFRDRSSVTDFRIPDTVQSIDGWAFGDCRGISGIKIPGSVVSIGYLAFADCSGVKCIELSEGLQRIDDYAFSGCSGVDTVKIPASVTKIGWGVFSGIHSVKKVSVDKNNKVYRSAGNCIIERKTNTLIEGFDISVIPEDGSVKVIGDSAFERCRFGMFRIPEGITEIGVAAFGYTEIGWLIIPVSVKKVDWFAFEGSTI